MNNKGQVLETVLKIFLVLALAFILWTLITRYTGDFVRATSDCQPGYACVPKDSCDTQRAGVEFSMLGDCKHEEYICCTSPEIKVALANRILPMNDRSLVVTVDKLEGEFPVGREVPLFLGSPYNIDIKSFEPLVNKWCEVKIIDETTRAISIRNIGSSESKKAESKFNCVVDERSGNLNTGLIFDDILFLNEHKGRPLVLELIVYERDDDGRGEKFIEAEFPIEVVSPFRLIEPREEWKKEHEIAVRCIHGGCSEISLVPSSRVGAAEDYCTNAINVEDKEFTDREAEFFIGAQSLDLVYFANFYNNNVIIDAPVCFVGALENGEIIGLRTKNNIMIDLEPPVIEGKISNLKIPCEDEGSGCKFIYYDVRSDYTLEELQSTNFDTLGESLKQQILTGLTQRLTNIFTNSDGVEGCPNPGSSDYRRAINGEIDPRNTVGGSVCVYAVDAVGNIGEKRKLTFVDGDAIKDELGDEAANTLANELSNFLSDI